MTESPPSALVFDPFAPGFTDDPYPHYAEMRDGAPVHQHPVGFWLLTRYEDVSWLLRAGLSVEDRNLAESSPFRMMQEAMYGDRLPRFDARSMLDRDPPDHTRLRRLVAKAFTPRAVRALRPHVVELVDGMLDAMGRARRVDLIEALAFPLPFAVIAKMLGTPSSDHERIRELTGVVVRSLEPVADPDLVSAIVAADAELAGIAAEMIAWKRENPADDLLTALINAEDDGDVLGEEELIAQTLLLYIAGHETTVNLIGGGALALLRDPGQQALLRDDPGLVANAVEEMLRYDSPVQASRRITVEPVTVGGVEIPAGAFVMASLASANRDERFWGPDAGELRLNRENARQHVSFGAGPHHCLGASLARMEACIAFERLTARFPHLSRDGEVRWNGRINLRGPSHLPVSTG
ncbi:cytochrome P450 [Actinoallomurus iriomotensis]|uniref:Cytochrome P450 n=1 Tax=Actinoallomurus iriomotensis TaxID=478107 RepID=A0A9W6S2P9_9ACTN|nr:cytochrome P450 [Actinoallomurus iriomotensis]